jgi:hypothetical protein
LWRYDHACGVGEKGRLEDLTRVNGATIERAAAQFMDTDHPVLRVEQQHEADFDGLGLKALAQQICRVGRPAHLRQWAGMVNGRIDDPKFASTRCHDCPSCPALRI